MPTALAISLARIGMGRRRIASHAEERSWKPSSAGLYELSDPLKKFLKSLAANVVAGLAIRWTIAAFNVSG